MPNPTLRDRLAEALDLYLSSLGDPTDALLPIIEQHVAERVAEVERERDEAKANARTAWDVHREHVDRMGPIIARHAGDATFATIRADRAEATLREVRTLANRADARVDSAHRLVTTTALRAVLDREGVEPC